MKNKGEKTESSLPISGQDDHTSLFSLQWLSRNLHSPGTKVERFLWDGLCMSKEQLPTTLFDHHMNFEDGLKNTLKNIIKYGFCIVDGVGIKFTPPSEMGNVSNKIDCKISCFNFFIVFM